MADHDLTINQDGMFGQLENLLSEREAQLLQENEQELEGEQEPETEENEEQEEEEEEEEEQEQEDENGQEQEQEKKQEKENVDASVVADRWPGWPGESVFRMLVPSQKVGGIIGRKGEFIKKMCEEAKARIKILDGPAGTPERAVMVSAKEEPDLSLPPAVDGLLKVHKRVVDGLDDSSHAPASGVKVTTRLLVPAGQAGNLIGKQGTTVKSIQEKSDCIVRITEDLPTFALQDDRIVEVVGEPTAVHKAVELVALHLRKFLVDRSIIPIFEMQMQNPPPPPQMEHAPPPTQSWGPPPFAPNVPGPNYRGASTPSYRAHTHYAPPQQQQHNSYYQPAELLPPPLEKQPHQGISAYGREAPLSSNNQPPQSMSTQVLQQIQIPLSYADAVIGNAGGTISYIRRASGATVTIQETRGVPGEMTVEITGNASQVQTAQQLIQNYIADAQAQPSAATADQTYNPYAAAAPTPTLGGSAYATQTGNPSLGGGYGSVYGTNYGY